MRSHDEWHDSHNSKVQEYVFLDGAPAVLLWWGVTFATMIALVVITAIFDIGDLVNGSGFLTYLSWVGVSVVAGVASCGAIRRKLPTRREKLLESGLLADTSSYAYQALERELEKLSIYIRDMNDKFDHEVGVQHISEYLRLTREPTLLIDAGMLDENEERRRELQLAINDHAREYATIIRYYFDQRELARQARERDAFEEARRIEVELREQIAAQHSARAEVWLGNHRQGLIG